MLLEGRELSYRYDKSNYLFRGFNLSVQSGEIVGLAGPSGVGKTTLARLLAGYETAEEGQVLLNGSPIPVEGYHPVQLIFQHPERAVNPKWRLARSLEESGAVEAQLLHAFGIKEHWMKRFPAELSGGELQRFCIVRALARGTRFLIADEMTTMLDAITQAQIWRTVIELARTRKLGMLVISHDRHLINQVCDRSISWNASSAGNDWVMNGGNLD